MNDRSFGIIPFIKDGDDYKFLLIQHVSGDGNGAHWSFPKGHKEKGESEKDAAMREFKEETGIEKVSIIDGKEIIERYFFTKRGETINKVVKFFLGFLASPERVNIQPEEVYNYKWVTFSEAMRFITFSEAKGTLKRA